MNLPGEVYEENRRFLWGVCYRMTGNAADAEEIVQETFVKAIEKPPPDTQQPWRPWLLRVAMNLSRNQLRQRRQRGYEGPWLPGPVLTTETDHDRNQEQGTPIEESPVSRYEMLESISFAFLLALEALSPSQRAVLLLRDVFDYSTSEAAEALEMSESAVKVTLHRARRIMRDYDKNRATDPARNKKVKEALERFLHLLGAGDSDGLEELLAEDVILVTDIGGEVDGLLKPLNGRKDVLRFVTRLNEANRGLMKPIPIVLNGQPAILVRRQLVKWGKAAVFTLQCEIDSNGRIARLNYVLAPSKLSAVVPLAGNVDQ